MAGLDADLWAKEIDDFTWSFEPDQLTQLKNPVTPIDARLKDYGRGASGKEECLQGT